MYNSNRYFFLLCSFLLFLFPSFPPSLSLFFLFVCSVFTFVFVGFPFFSLCLFFFCLHVIRVCLSVHSFLCSFLPSFFLHFLVKNQTFGLFSLKMCTLYSIYDMPCLSHFYLLKSALLPFVTAFYPFLSSQGCL